MDSKKQSNTIFGPLYDKERSDIWLRFIDEIIGDIIIADAYFDSFKIIAADLKMNKYFKVSTLAYPMFYLIRHGIELYLKCFIRQYASIMDKNNEIKHYGHDINPIYQDVKQFILQTSNHFSENDILFCDKFVGELGEIDPKSDKFRYSVDYKNNPHFNDPQLFSFKRLEMHTLQLIEIFENWWETLNNLSIKYGYIGRFKDITPWEIMEIANLFPARYSEKILNEVYNKLPLVSKKIKIKQESQEQISFDSLNEIVEKIIMKWRLPSSRLGIIRELHSLNSKDIKLVFHIYKIYRKKLDDTFPKRGKYEFATMDFDNIFSSNRIFNEIVSPAFDMAKSCDIITIYNLGRDKGRNENRYEYDYNNNYQEINHSLKNNSYNELSHAFDKYDFLEGFCHGLDKLAIPYGTRKP